MIGSHMPSRQDDRPPAYQFGGGHGNGRPRSPLRRDRVDSYRPDGLPPRPPPSQFSFRYQSDRPAPHFPPPPPQPRHQANQSHGRGRGRPDTGRHHARYQREQHSHSQAQNFPHQPRRPYNLRRRGALPKRHPATSDRPLMLGERGTTPEQLDGTTSGEARFNAWDDLSDSEETDMDLESNTSDNGHRPTKKARVEEPPTAKWTNPDPYSALPPPALDETHGKRKDVVRVIRKAKTATAKVNAIAKNSDFISLDDDDDDDTDSSTGHASDGKAHGTKAGFEATADFITISDDSSSHASNDEAHYAGRSSPPSQPLIHDTYAKGPAAPPPMPSDVKEALEIDIWPPPPPPPPPQPPLPHGLPPLPPGPPPLRFASDIGTAPAPRPHGLPPLPPGPPPSGFTSDMGTAAPPPKGRKRKWNESYASRTTSATIMPEWLPDTSKPTAPWYKPKVAKTEDVGSRLHKEVCDFYDYVRPLAFEDELRAELIRRVQDFLDRRFADFEAKVFCFGSFAAGIYLPNADMDLAVHSEDFRATDYPVFCQTPKAMRRFASSLEQAGLAKPHSTFCIPKAKVPIVKYVDALTDLKVDICFENSTGVTANRTYETWKRQYPAMMMIITLVKQFLLMRGLNDVSIGGIGGFSVTCLVVSLLQHLPHIQLESMDPMHHLGEVLMEFFDFYGNRFDTTSNGISLNPPAYFQKHLNRDIRHNQLRPGALSIVDPNRATNDISGGSHNSQAIFRNFSEAFSILQKRMSFVSRGNLPPDDNGSILGAVFAGNYTSFHSQRNKLRQLYHANM